MTTEKRNRKNSWQRALQISHIAFLIPAGIFVGYALGYYLDKVFETTFIRIIGLL
ncbi:MAG TPA: AtpZ/AtpI family protein, partial [Bryobacterales bacterium]|nr:AtpZ/AtpI family protein [Bryobacterales bacterium]